MKGEDNYLEGYSLNGLCLYLILKMLGFTAERC